MKFGSSVAVAISALVGTATAQVGMGRPPNPLDKARANLVEEFVWRDPFVATTEESFEPSCEVTKSFPAQQYTLHQLFDKAPLGLFSWAEGLKKFWSESEYPGSWSGLDRHGWDRNVLLMEYEKVPLRVREWIEKQDEEQTGLKGLFAIFDKPKDKHERIKERVEVSKEGPLDRDLDGKRVILFAPGALYTVLPLFVADESECKTTLADLSRYSSDPFDGNVVAWITEHSRPVLKDKKRDIDFTIKAQVLREKTEAEKQKAAKEEL